MRHILNATLLAVIMIAAALAAYAWLFQWTAGKQADLPRACAGVGAPVECIAKTQEVAGR